MDFRNVPAWLRALFVAVMLLLCSVLAWQLFHQASLRGQIDQLQAELDVTRQRLAKQQMEYDEAVAALPQVQSELALVQPQADAVYQQEQALRQARKELRAENAALVEALHQLQPELDAASAAVLDCQLAAEYLEDALVQLRLAMQ